MRLPAALLLTLHLLLAACASPRADADAPLPADTTGRGAALRLLASADTSAFRSAFAALAGRTYTRYERFGHWTDGVPSGTQTRVLRVSPDGAAVLADTRTGVFATESVLQETFAPADAREADLSPVVLPADPPYLQARHYDAYAYAVLPDTTLGGRTVRVVDVHARPGADDVPAIRHARYYIDGSTGRLVAARIARVDRGLGFSETSVYYLRVRPAGDAFVPDIGRFTTTTVLPFRAPRRVTRAVAYYGLGGG